MDEICDVAIVGGGVIGSAIAYFLRREDASCRIVVIERDPSYKSASSALSASSIRQQFSTPANIRMSRFGVEFLRNIDGHLAVDDPVSVGFVERGYLYLARADQELSLRENYAVQSAEGADVALLGRTLLADRFNWFNVEDLACASLGLSGEGWFDGYALMQAFRRKARALGAKYRHADVLGVSVAERRVVGVTFGDGSGLRCAAAVNAAGPWARAVANKARLELPVEARPRCVFVFDARRTFDSCPLVIDSSGAWFRPEGEYFIGGTSPPEAEDRDALPLEVDYRQFEEMLWPALAHRVPAFEAVKLVNAWSGYYEYNVFDQNAVLGPHPELRNFFFANGFSGHGIQQAPAVGRAIAELILHGRYTTLDLAVFSYQRLVDNKPVRERNVLGCPLRSGQRAELRGDRVLDRLRLALDRAREQRQAPAQPVNLVEQRNHAFERVVFDREVVAQLEQQLDACHVDRGELPSRWGSGRAHQAARDPALEPGLGEGAMATQQFSQGRHDVTFMWRRGS